MASLPSLRPSPSPSSANNRRLPLLPLTLSSLKPPPPSYFSFLPSSTSQRRLLPRVLTAPAEFSSPSPPDFHLRQELSRLLNLRDALSPPLSVSHKLRVIREDPRVRRFFADYGETAFRALRKAGLGKDAVYLVHCLVAAGQEHVLGSLGTADVGPLAGGSRGAVKTALYSLVGMIERLQVGDNDGRLATKTGEESEEEAEVGRLRRLLKVLREVESFYDCIGGIIG